MTLQLFPTQNTSNLHLMSLIKNGPYNLFEIISSHLKPQDYLNFLCTSKEIYEINNTLKEYAGKSYYKLRVKIFSNGLRDKPVGELSTKFLKYSREAFIDFKIFLDSLIECGRFKELSVATLSEAFIICCSGDAAIVELFINSNRFYDLPVRTLREAFVISAFCDGEVTRTLINSSRFQEIDKNCLGCALQHASASAQVSAVKAILECSRVNEISRKHYIEALFWATFNGDDRKIEKRIEIMRMLINFYRFKEVPQEVLIDIMISAARNGRGGEVVELIQASNFSQLNRNHLNDIFEACVAYFQPISVKFFMESNRFEEITEWNLGHCLREAARHKDSEILQVIISSGRLNEIDLQDFIEAMHSASGLPRNNVGTIPIKNLKLLIDSPRFSELSFEILEKIIETAEKANRVNNAHPCFNYDRKDAVALLRQNLSKFFKRG